MNIQFHAEPGRSNEKLDDELRAEQPVKYVVVAEPDTERSTIVFQASIQHFEMVHALLNRGGQARLIGGGRINVASFVRRGRAGIEWNADSLREQYGYDRPEDPAERQVIEEELRTEIEKQLRMLLADLL